LTKPPSLTALDTAQDLEAVAVEGLINTPSEWPGDIGVKQDLI